jgi:hypothetical protein
VLLEVASYPIATGEAGALRPFLRLDQVLLNATDNLGLLSLLFDLVGSPDLLILASSGDSRTAVLHASRC